MILSVIIICAGAASAATIEIRPSNSTTQDAINGTSDGDTIDLSAGTYNEHDITVNKNMTIKGPQVRIKGTSTSMIDSHGPEGYFKFIWC